MFSILYPLVSIYSPDVNIMCHINYVCFMFISIEFIHNYMILWINKYYKIILSSA